MPYDFPKISPSVSSPFNENVRKLSELFPSVMKDGKLDLDELRAQLGEFDEVGKEKYGLTWAGKADAQKKTGEPLVGKTLKYVKADSKNPETTQNIYIEGDNLEALKLLQNAYRGKVKMIYIDPPYNTGNDFVYNDKFSETADETAVAEGDAAVVDGKLERYAVNSKTNGKYHGNWLSMMYPRLQLARNLLSEDGVIFISIDDNEQANLKELCDDIFGGDCFVGTIPWRKRTAKSDVPFGLSQDYEWILCYAKGILFKASIEGGNRKYFETPDFPNRPWRIHDMTCQRTASERPNSYFTMINPKTGDEYNCDPNRVWRVTKDTFQKYYDANEIVFPGEYDFLKISKPVARYFKDKDMEKAGDDFGKIAVSTKLPDDIGMSQDGTKEMKSIFGCIPFSFPKSVKLIQYLLKVSTKEDALILDFFSGSATTAHAVMQLNAEDGGNRKFILVQLPEACDEKSEAYKAGYKTICDIGKERIRRAGDKIKAEHPLAEIDTGFKVFRVDDTNIKWIARELAGDLSFTSEPAAKTAQATLGDTFGESQPAGTKKDDIDFMPKTNDIDIVYEILLHQYDIPLTVDIEKCGQIGTRTYSAASSIIICLEENVTPEIIEKIAAVEPVPKKIFFRDSAFNDDISLKENAMLRLDALMQMHLTADAKGMKGRLPYSVEFI